jgi:hypothetical protein
MKITFTPLDQIENEYYPIPAESVMPEWFSKMASYGGFNDEKEGHRTATHLNEPNATIKKCVPVLDAISAGYLLLTPNEIFAENAAGEPDQSFKARGPMGVTTHKFGQAKHHPNGREGVDFPKLGNPWLIKTPPGYSVLIVPPLHRPNGFFKIFPGVIDTDVYTQAINFPFMMDDHTFTGSIPPGTPYAQVIPFKRESWKMEIGGHEELDEAHQVGKRHMTRIFNVYKQLWWHKKEFK